MFIFLSSIFLSKIFPMPIEYRVKFPRLSEDEMRAIDYRVMSHVFATQNELGRLCDESVYQLSLATRLIEAGFRVRIEEPITLTFRDFTTTLFVDLVVDDKVPYELKAVSRLSDEHENQLLNYMLMMDANRGKVVNFRSDGVQSRFVNAPLPTSERRRFEIDDSRWSGDAAFRRLVTELVADWGTSLEQSHYIKALVACLGGEDRVIRQIPMASNGQSLGNQRFLLAAESIPFRLTTFPDGAPQDFEKQLHKLLMPSPFELFYWVNIGRHCLEFRTVRQEDVRQEDG